MLQPLVMAKAVSIHPLAVALSVAAGTVLAGIVGAVVAVPLVSVVYSVGRFWVQTTPRQPNRPPPPALDPTGTGAGQGTGVAGDRLVVQQGVAADEAGGHRRRRGPVSPVDHVGAGRAADAAAGGHHDGQQRRHVPRRQVGSTATSTAPSATSMCDRKSP